MVSGGSKFKLINHSKFLLKFFPKLFSIKIENNLIFCNLYNIKNLYSFIYYLKNISLFNYNKLIDIVCTDTLRNMNRFKIFYILQNSLTTTKLIVSCSFTIHDSLESIHILFKNST